MAGLSVVEPGTANLDFNNPVVACGGLGHPAFSNALSVTETRAVPLETASRSDGYFERQAKAGEASFNCGSDAT